MYAVIETGGKQYRVQEQDTFRVEKLPVEPGEEVTIDKVLLIGGEGEPQVGTPYLEGASVIGRVLRQGKGRKIKGFTYKRRKRVQKRWGHRQRFTELQVERIVTGS